MASKGKAIAGKDSSGKRKRKDNDNGVSNKRKNRDVLQFFEDSAAEFDGDNSDDSDDFFDIDEFLNDYPKVKSEPDGFEQFPSFPKEEELSGDELEKMLAERYRTKSGYVRYAEDDYDTKRSVDKSFLIPSVVEPTIWKVKCKVGREKNTVFCLIQKFVDLKDLGTKLQIISAFAVEHIKGFVFIEAEKQSDVAEACNQLADVYYSLVTKVPSNEVGKLLVVKKRYNEVKEGTWARVKNGIYRGDLAQVVAVNNVRKRATVKLIPRIDLQALTEKYGGGAISKRTKGSIPAARLISSRDLEEFRPLIQYRRDRDTGKMFEFLDSLMLKDGFLYKKVSIDSLSFWGVNPSEDELQKFTVPSNDESDNVEWLSQLYGEQKKKCNMKIDKGGGKGECSSGSHEQSSFEVHDLVLFGKRDFGMVIGMEKDDNYKILKDGSTGPVILTLGQKELKYVPQDKKFTALDHRMKTISINDTVRILDGPSKERQGIVKQIYRGIIFLYDENDLDNAYCCTKSQMSEKVKNAGIVCHGKDDGGPSNFEDVPSSPKSPLSPKKVWEMRGNNNEGKDELFSVGQSLRIRIGPLKGYLCRVVAIRYSDVTVKLDSKQKVLTVNREHLVEVREKGSASLIGDPESSSPFKPFDLLGAEGATNDWLQASGSADGDGWNAGGLSSERSAWPAFPSSSSSLQVGTSAINLHSSVDNDDWLSKVAVGIGNAVDDTVGAWSASAGSWGKEKAPSGDHGGSWNIGGSSLRQGKSDNAANSWGNQSAEKGQPDSWDKGKRTEEQGAWNDIGSCGASGYSGWGKQKACVNSATWEGASEFVKQSVGNAGGDAWARPKSSSGPAEDSWGNAADGWGKKNDASESSGWGTSAAASSNFHAKDPENRGSEDPWGKVADKWGNKDSSNRGNEWGHSSNKSAGDGGKGWGISSGGWANSQKENAEVCGSASGGWKSSGGSGAGDNWGKPGGFGADSISSFDKTGGNDSWGQPKNFENDGGFSRGRGPGGRGRGRDQFGRGRGRGRSFDRGQSSSFNKDGQDNYSPGSKDWSNQPGSSWGNSSVENVGLTSSWGKGKSWNDKGDDNKGWNESNEPDNDVGGWSLQKSSTQTGWNGTSSGASSWGQKSLESGGNCTQDKDMTCADDPWGKLSSKTSNNKSGAFQGSWGGGQGNLGGWKKDDTLTSSGWTKSGDVSSEGRDSWSKPEGRNSWESARNSDNDQGHSWGGGSGGRRGGRGGFRGGRDQSSRGGFRGGRDQFGRGGGGRLGGQGQFFSWKNEGQNDGGSSWGNSSSTNNEQSSWSKGGWSTDGGGQDSSWKKPAEGGSSWGAGSKVGWSSGEGVEDTSWKRPIEGSSFWGAGSKGVWKSDGGAEDTSWKKPIEGGSSWGGGTDDKASRGYSSSCKGGWSTDGAGGGFGEDMGWKKPSEGGSSSGGRTDNKGGWGSGRAGDREDTWKKPSEGGSSWGGATDIKTSGNNVGSSGTKGWSSGDGPEEKPGGGGLSWGGESNNKKSGWGNDSSSNGQHNAVNESSRSGNWVAGQAGSSWGNSRSGLSSDDAGGGWGK